MLPYAAFLRVYEPLSAFSGPDARHWAAYVASAARPRRPAALAAEHADARRRLLSVPPVVVPDRESGHAYVRWAEEATYVCPWQTRLRSWLGLSRLRATDPQLWSAAFTAGAAGVSDAAVRGPGQASSLRIHIQVRTWSVPPAWFVPFAPAERWLVLGAAGDPGDGGRAAATPTRTLVYVTAMAHARTRVGRALDAVRCASAPGGPLAGTPAGDAVPRLAAELAQIGCWLEEFHPDALVELDYGGLVHLLGDAALRADQSAAEVSAAISALTSGEPEMATAMYGRVTGRWAALAALEHAS